MNLTGLNQEIALQLIGRLRQGRNVIFGANLFSVGREDWIKGAHQVFDDIEVTGDSVVRFLRGNYGVGKTNFAARLFQAGLARGWVAAYVELSDQVMLHEFHQVFSQIVDRIYLPEQLDSKTAQVVSPRGFVGVLDLHFRKLRRAMNLDHGADIPASARGDLISRVNVVLQSGRIYGEFAFAIRSYFEARIDNDRDTVSLLERWFRGEPGVGIRGILRPVSKVTGKEYLRCLSAFLIGVGYKGLLIIIDELERIMEESQIRRRKSYTILRELIDNVDGENGMRRTCLYAAAPPGQFESQKGFIEVEALASRIQAPLVLRPGLVDYTATIIDLDTAPLTEDEQVELARNIRGIHSIARDWPAEAFISDTELKSLVKEINAERTYTDTRVREFCVEIVSRLESVHHSTKNVSNAQ
jgi:hypothetical protein